MTLCITNYNNINDWFYLIIAVLAVDLVALILTKYPGANPFFKVGALDDWYTKFNVLAVTSDVTSTLIGIAVTRYIYTALNLSSPFLFILILFIFQLCHDAFFYLAVIKPLPEGHNKMIDVFKAYAKENGGKILGADALLMISSVALALVLKNQPAHISVSVALLTIYALCYIVYTRKALSNTSL